MRSLKKLLLICLMGLLMTGCTLPWQSVTAPNGESGQDEETLQQSEDQVNETASNTLVVAMNTPKTLNPLYNTQSNVMQALYLIYSPLVNIEEDGTLSSSLAESWVVSESQTAVTVTLRQGLKWHDGTPLTSEDVIFTLNQIQQITDCPYKQAVENIQTVEKIDATTVKIIYKQSFSGILQTLFFPVIPKHIYGVENQDVTTIKPVGSGPYCYEGTIPLESIRLKANPDYFKGQPKIPYVQINLIPNEESSLYSFKQGLIDVVYTENTEWGKYTNSTANTAYEMVSPIYEFVGLNMNKAVFQNPSVRSALVYGLNREDIVRLYYLGHAVVTDSPISPASYLYDKTSQIKSYDKEKAKFLLAQEGYQKDEETGYMMKDGIPLRFKLLVNEESNERLKVAKEMQMMYQEIGIELEIEKVDKETYLSRIKSKDYEAFLGAYQLSYATDLSFALHSSSVSAGGNYTSYKDPVMDELLQKAFVATQETAPVAYSALQQYFEEANPYISLFFKKSVLITKNNVGGSIHPTPLNIFANIEEWTLS